MTTLSLLHIFDSMDALETIRPSMLADITVSAVERLWLFTADIAWFEVVYVLAEFADYLTLSYNLAGIATSTLLP